MSHARKILLLLRKDQDDSFGARPSPLRANRGFGRRSSTNQLGHRDIPPCYKSRCRAEISKWRMNTNFGYKVLMVVVAAIPLVMLSAFLVISLSGGADPAKEHYEAGIQLHDQGRFRPAIEEYDKSISLSGGGALVYAKRGDTYYALREFNFALDDYGRSISLRSDLVPRLGAPEYLNVKQALADSYMGRAMVYTVLGRDLDAQRNVGQAIEYGYGEDLARKKLDEIKSRR